jgi:hypothetical protein
MSIIFKLSSIQIKNYLESFFTNNFFDIFNENPKAIKWITPPMIAACIKLSRRNQDTAKVVIDGTVTITAIIEPFKIISFIVSLLVLLSLDIKQFSKNGNKNQRDFTV